MPSQHAKYNLLKRSLSDGSKVWYVRFWDDSIKKWAVTRNTYIRVEGKRERYSEAADVANEMLKDIHFAGDVRDALLVPFDVKTFKWSQF